MEVLTAAQQRKRFANLATPVPQQTSRAGFSLLLLDAPLADIGLSDS